MALLGACSNTVLRLLACSGAATAARAAEVTQIAVNAAVRSFSSSCASSSASSWNHNPHTLPSLSLPKLDVPQHDIEDGKCTLQDPCCCCCCRWWASVETVCGMLFNEDMLYCVRFTIVSTSSIPAVSKPEHSQDTMSNDSSIPSRFQ